MDSKKVRAIILSLLIAMLGSAANSHPGGLNAAGCHNNRKTGDYHCHGGGRAVSSSPQHAVQSNFAAQAREDRAAKAPASSGLPPGCFVGPRGGTYTITKSGRKNYGGC